MNPEPRTSSLPCEVLRHSGYSPGVETRRPGHILVSVIHTASPARWGPFHCGRVASGGLSVWEIRELNSGSAGRAEFTLNCRAISLAPLFERTLARESGTPAPSPLLAQLQMSYPVQSKWGCKGQGPDLFAALVMSP